jgi:hypothetical protein
VGEKIEAGKVRGCCGMRGCETMNISSLGCGEGGTRGYIDIEEN